METAWLGGWKGLLLGQPVSKEHSNQLEKLAETISNEILDKLHTNIDLEQLKVTSLNVKFWVQSKWLMSVFF